MSLTSISSLPNLSGLNCWNCPSLTSIPSLPNLTQLICYNCPLLTIIPSFPELIELDCHNCPILTHIHDTPKLDRSSRVNYTGCKWLIVQPEIINKLIVIQRRVRQMVKYFRFIRFIKSREFNEWFYAPEGIGGKMNKIRLENFVNNI